MAGASDRVRVLKDVPRVEVINRYLPDADIFLAPTFSDSFGVSILEAMAEGLPVVATNLNAIPEMIEDEKEGLLIDNSMGRFPLIDNSFHMKHSWLHLRDAPFPYYEYVNDHLKEKLVRLIENPELRKSLGIRARRKFENSFNMNVRTSKFAKVYREAVEA
jgi:glycosyltransferase involved in cell wall biosynthesis